MTNLEDEVRSVVLEFMKSEELFTALDVSNKVKLALPLARHREVRDVVRGLFSTEIEPAGWARSPINVTLTNGAQTEALLYHPLADSWDLDSKYDTQKRHQAALNPTAQAAQALGLTQTTTTPTPVVSATVPAAPAKNLPMRDRWMQLFDSKPSLFPMK